jgi:hypothetical protein
MILYLYTPSARDYYAKLGWDVVEQEDHRGANVTIMSMKLK